MRCSRLPHGLSAHKKKRLPVPAHRFLLDEFSTPTLKVWVVDGRAVRDGLSVDFSLAGHDAVYAYVPKGEVWVESGLSPSDRKFILVHELWERRLMGGGMPYEQAHVRANKLERIVRANPRGVDEVLRVLVKQNS